MGLGLAPASAVVLLLLLLSHTAHAATNWCPAYHVISGHYDPSGPILVDDTWHVFPDGCPNGWCHYTSKDLLRWELQDPLPALGNGDTGSVSVTDAGTLALFPALQAPDLGLSLQSAVSGVLSKDVQWTNSTMVLRKPDALGVGFRDPTRALQLAADGLESWYVGVGSGFGGANNETGLPGTGTGCLAWFRAENSSLSSFEYVGCLLQVNQSLGHVDPSTVSWETENKEVAFVECPDVFLIEGKLVIVASLYNWANGGYFTNEWWVGKSAGAGDGEFVPEAHGLLDHGQYYAARTGAGIGAGASGRRVVFSATGWHNPPGFDASCNPQIHLIPRDLSLDKSGLGLNIAPIPEIATLRVPPAESERASGGGEGPAASGASVELALSCTGAPSDAAKANGSTVVGLEILATANRSAYTTVGFDFATSELFVDHSKSSASFASSIRQAAPDRLAATGAESSLTIYVLVDGALVESFLNNRTVISSWVSELMADGGDGGVPPADRETFVVPPPEGVLCELQSYRLMALL